MTATNNSAERIRQEKEIVLAREHERLSTTLALLLEQSIDKVTVSKIAVRAGIGKGTVYKHFS